MPNYCENTLHIEGTEEEMNTFIKENAGQDETGESVSFTFSASMPIPEAEENNWYEWSVENWGTKWDAEIYSEWDCELGIYQISFNTAWCPPIEYIENVSKLYPNLTFSLYYVEHGEQFCGEVVAHNGLININETDYENVYGVFCEECDDFCQNEDEHQIN